jgi:hypothetical protein
MPIGASFFLINVPVGIVALLIGLRVLPTISAGRGTGRLDAWGMRLGPLAFSSVSFGVSQSTSAGWFALPTLGGVGLGVIALALFVWRELNVADPILDLRVFKSLRFSLAILTQ